MSEKTVEFKWHPHALKALGPELVTNDLVAILEIVKNSYDAFAKNVDVIFEYHVNDTDFETDKYAHPLRLIIMDDGCGMNEDDIVNNWFVIGTPNKIKNNKIEFEGEIRQVSGAKGIGRLSTARLGKKLTVITKKENEKTIEFTIYWDNLFSDDSLPKVIIKSSSEKKLKTSGTLLIIENLYNKWGNHDILSLSEGLKRFTSPFEPRKNFEINLKITNGLEKFKEFKIRYQSFLDNPTYRIKGSVDENGNINAIYEHRSIDQNKIVRTKKCIAKWEDKDTKIEALHLEHENVINPCICGKFSYEIRCWDTDPLETEKLTSLYKITKSQIKDNIRFYKGLSVYRDDILVMPKDEGTRDWLGLDLRRISRVGERISTSQIIGCVYISATDNKNLLDASDRESLAENEEVRIFKQLLLKIIHMFEEERNLDKARLEKEPSIIKLFEKINADELLNEIDENIEDKKIKKEILGYVKNHQNELTQTRQLIEKNFRYYGQLATLGQVSSLILHEISNGLVSIGLFLNQISNYVSVLPTSIIKYKNSAEISSQRLNNLASAFIPLATRNTKNIPIVSNLYEVLKSSLLLLEKEINDHDVKISYSIDPKINVKINPAELQTVFINLILNSIYWLTQNNDKNNRIINIGIKKIINNEDKITIEFIDNGPGIDFDDREIIFQPGITKKNNGLGMGLPIIVFLLDKYKGKIAVDFSKKTQGAKFDIELIREEK